MKAAMIRRFGDVDVLKYGNLETPGPRPGHILIKVLAAGINRFDHYIREGSVVPELPFPTSWVRMLPVRWLNSARGSTASGLASA